MPNDADDDDDDEGQILPFPIDFYGRPYNTLTLPCEPVMVNYNRTLILHRYEHIKLQDFGIA